MHILKAAKLEQLKAIETAATNLASAKMLASPTAEYFFVRACVWMRACGCVRG